MKNFLFIMISVLTMVLFSFDLLGQFGVRVGVNHSKINFAPDQNQIDYGTKMGYGFGVFYQLKSSENLVFQPEFNFMQHGSRITLSLVGESGSISQIFNYLQMPIMVKYIFGDTNSTNFYIQGGPYLGLGIGKIISKASNNIYLLNELEFGDDDETLRRTDFGLQLGGGLNLNSQIFFDARYILGVADVTRSDESTMKQTGINLSVGYRFK